MATTRWVRIGIDPTAAKQGAKHVEASLSAIKKQAGGLQSSFSTLSGVLSKFAAAAVGVGVVARSIAQATVQMQTMRSTLNLVGGSVEAGTKELAFLREEANRLGLSLVDSATAYGKFSYAARAGGLSAAETRKVFSSVMEASRAFGLSSDQASGALLAMEQMMSKGVVAAEELRGQLGERLPGAFTMAAKAMGMTTQELGKALQMGEVLAVDLLPKLADALRADLKEAAEEAAQGLQAQMARLSTAWFDFRAVISDSGVGEGFARLVGTLAEWLQWLASNWHAVMAAIYASFRDATEKLLGLINAAIDVQLRAVQGLYSMLEKLPSIIPGVEKQKTALEGLRAWFESAKGDFLLTYLESLAETFDEKYNAALDRAAEALKSTGEAASDVRPSVQGLGKDSEKAAKELAKLVEEALRLGASHNEVFRWQRELEDALGVMAKLEAAGLENSRAWNAVADAIVQIAKGLDEAQQAAYKLATVKMDDAWAGITSGAKNPVSERNDQIGRGMLAEMKRADDELTRLAEDFRREMGGVWGWFDEEVAKIRKAQEAGLVSARDAAGMIQTRWIDATGAMAGSIADSFAFIEQVAGGTFGRIAGYISSLARGVQGATQFGSSVSQAATSMKFSAGTAGAMGSVATMAGIYMAIYQLGKQIVADRAARRYSPQGEVGISGGHLSWAGGEFAQQMRDLISSIEDTLGGSFSSLSRLAIKVRNDGKDVQAFVDGVMIGKFKSVDEAIKAAFTRALRTSSLSGVDALVAQGVAQLRYSSIDEALSKLGALREIAQLDFGSGLTSLLESVRGLEQLWAVLAELREATPAVVAGFERLAAAEARAWQEARDAITGRERTAEEERAYREQQAQIFNAELALRKAELELRRWELAQELDLLRARVEIARGRGELGLSEERIRRGELVRQGEVLGAELSMRSDYLQALGALAQGEAKIRQATLEVGKTAVEAQIELLEAQLAALDQLLAALPTSIDLGEIRIPSLGGVDVSAGGGGDPLGDFLREVATLSRSLLPPAARQLAELNLQFEELVARALELGVSTEELDRIYGEMLAALQADARKPWQEILAGNGPQADFDRIIQAMIAGLQDYFDLGLDGTEVMQAAAVQLAALRDSILSSLSPTYAMQMQIDALAEQIGFLQTNMEALGLSAADLDAILGELQLSNFLSLAERMAGYLDDQGLLMELEQLRWELERGNLRMQMDLLLEAGALSEEQYERLVRIWDRLPDAAPAGFGSGRGGRGSSPETRVFSDAVDRFRRATEQLIAFQQDLLLGPQSALSPEERFLEAQRRYQDVYQRALAGDLDAREQFAQVARDYLDAARDFFASSESYALIFEQIRRALEVLIGMSPPQGGSGASGPASGGLPRGATTLPGGVPWWLAGGYPAGGGGAGAGSTPASPGVGRLEDEIRNSGQSQARGTELLRRELETMRESQAEQLGEIRRLNTTLTRREAQAPRRSSAA